jgi:hypothetical protein
MPNSDRMASQQQETERTRTVGERVMDWVRNNHAQQPKLGAEVRAWMREGAKDLWNAIVPAFPDSMRGTDELGTPLNPTAQNVTQDLGNFHGYDEMLRSHAERLQGREPAQDRDQGPTR